MTLYGAGCKITWYISTDVGTHMYVIQAKIETQEGFLKSFENRSFFGKPTSKELGLVA